MAIFEVNEHKFERIARVLVGAVLVSLFFVGPETPWGLIGFIPLLTGIFGFCPLYRLVGFSTCGKDCGPDSTPA